MDEQMLEKRYTESERYAKAVETGMGLGTLMKRLGAVLQHAKVRAVRYPGDRHPGITGWRQQT